MLGQLPAARVGEAAGSLLHGYQDATGERVSGLGAYVSDGLLRLAHYPFRMHQPDWPQNTQQILARAEEILAGCG